MKSDRLLALLLALQQSGKQSATELSSRLEVSVRTIYRDVLGMTPTAIDESMSGAEFELADGTTFGVWQPGEAKSGAGYSALFAVTDINAAVTRFRAQGATLSDPFETTVCFMSFGKDPDGNEFGIHQRKKT